jgi:hypothetical protein
LNEPVRCRVSALRKTRAPVAASSTGEEISGVRSATPRCRRAAASISAAVGARSSVFLTCGARYCREMSRASEGAGAVPALREAAMVRLRFAQGSLLMDLGIAGRKAIVCASSRGLGRACAFRLAEAGCEVVVNGRDKARTEGTAPRSPRRPARR